MTNILSRRTFLRGSGVALSLPLLEAMMPAAARAGSQTVKSPVRMAFVFTPNGVNVREWSIDSDKTNTADFELSPTLRSLKPWQKKLLVFRGLAQDKGNSYGDGGGDHARSAAAYLTGVHPKKTSGEDIHNGVSVDQVAAQAVGHLTPFPSLELGCERGQVAGRCDTGYSCAYTSNISWRNAKSPMAKEINPRLLFDRLFGQTDHSPEQKKRNARKQSLLNFVQEDARSLRTTLGVNDKRKLDEYLYAVRQIEHRLERAEQPKSNVKTNMKAPEPGIPRSFQEHIRLMYDLMALAFETDLTRIATFMISNEGTGRSYRFIGVPDGHHNISHHRGDKHKLEKIAKIDRFHVEQFAYFLGKLDKINESNGTLLDNSMISMGAGLGDGNRHHHNDLPCVLAGGGGGTLKTGRYLRYKEDTPMNNLFLSMLHRMDVKIETLGDSTGKLNDLNSLTG